MNESIEFKSGDKVRYVDDHEHRLIGTILRTNSESSLAQVEFGDPSHTTIAIKSNLCLVETRD
jgi:hypothetical protein